MTLLPKLIQVDVHRIAANGEGNGTYPTVNQTLTSINLWVEIQNWSNIINYNIMSLALMFLNIGLA